MEATMYMVIYKANTKVLRNYVILAPNQITDKP